MSKTTISLLFKTHFTFILLCIAAIQHLSAQPTLLQDISTTLVSANPRGMTTAGNNVFFSANDEVHGAETWKYDGVSGATEMIKDINLNGDANPANFCNVNGTVFFAANDGFSGVELWKTNGTATGTVKVKDIVSGVDGSNPEKLTFCNGQLFFTAIFRTTINGQVTNVRRLWKSDGTANGTVVLGAIDNPDNLTAVGNVLFLTGKMSAATGVELLKTDGISISLVKDINAGLNSSSPTLLTNVNNTLFFAATDAVNGRQVWKSGGVENNTLKVSSLVSFNGVGGNIQEIAHVNGTVFFNVILGAAGIDPQLFRVNAQANGAVNLNLTGTRNLTACNGKLFFTSFTQVAGVTLGSFSPITNISTDIKSFTENNTSPESLIAVGNTLFFTAGTIANGRELWKSNGTTVGTVMVQDLNPGALNSDISNWCVKGSDLYFAATNILGNELRRSDGTIDGIVTVKNIGRAGSFPASFTKMGSKTFFTAQTNSTGRELWITDGTTEGTLLLKDIIVNSVGSEPKDLVVVTNGNVSTLFFTAITNIGRTLWKSDGTANGTRQVQDAIPGGIGTNPNNLVAFKGKVYYNATDVVVSPNGNVETKLLYESDGTSNGTKAVSGFAGAPRDPQFMTVAGDNLFFSATDVQNGRELWKYNGVTGGIVKNIRPSTASSTPTDLIAISNVLFFVANDGSFGRELFKSNGTTAGTSRISDIMPNAVDAGIQEMTNFNGTLFFTANSGIAGSQKLMKVNTLQTAVSDAVNNLTGVFDLRATAQALFFFRNQMVPAGVVLSKLQDGTVTELQTFSNELFGASASLHQMTAAGNNVYFVESDITNGYELWKSNGTVAGTQLVKDLRPGVGNSFIKEMKLCGTTLFFGANNLSSGQEPFILVNANSFMEDEQTDDRNDEDETVEVSTPEMRMFPNPATEYVRFEITANEATSELQLYAVTGQLVKSIAVPALTTAVRVELSDIPGGTYLVRWLTKEGIGVTRQLMVR